MDKNWYTRKIDGTFKPYNVNTPNRYALYALIGLLLCVIVAIVV